MKGHNRVVWLSIILICLLLVSTGTTMARVEAQIDSPPPAATDTSTTAAAAPATPNSQDAPTDTAAASPASEPALSDTGKKEAATKKDPSVATTQATAASAMEGGAAAAASIAGVSANTMVSVAANSGAATTTIPIEVPPGRAGIAPNLAITYSSSQENGMLGVGFRLDLGAIQRATKHGVNYSANDYVFSGNGSYSELVPRTEWNIVAGDDCYGAKIEAAFAKYCQKADGGWLVTSKDGTQYSYGASVASRQTNANGTFKWLLDKVEDTNGNYMEISYLTDSGEVYPNQIDYTGNTGLSPTNHVLFYYDQTLRTDAPPMYGSNAAVKTLWRLKTIKVAAANDIARAYSLSYESSPDTGRSRLSTVQLHGNDASVSPAGDITGGSRLPAVTFDWTDTSSLFGPSNVGAGILYPGSVGQIGDYSRLTGDLNGDGRTDMIWSYSGPGGIYVYTALGKGDGTFELAHGQPLSTINWGTIDKYVRLTGDFNGDGKTDLAWSYSGPSGLYVMTAIGKGDGTFDPMQAASYYSGDLGAINQYSSIPCDLNGDGKTDMAWSYSGPGGIYVYTAIGKGDGTFDLAQGQYLFTLNLGSIDKYPRLTGDFNGDGKADLAWTYSGPSGLYVFTAIGKGDGKFNDIHGDFYFLGNLGPINLYTSFPCDLNGDGKTDIVWSYSGSYGISVYTAIGKGDGTFEQAKGQVLFSIALGDGIYSRMTGDFNGDGRADLAWSYSGPSGLSMLTAKGKGDGTFQTAVPETVNAQQNLGQASYYSRLLGDFNGDGKADFAWSYSGPSGVWVFTSQQAVPGISDLLAQVVNGVGGTTSIAYTPSTGANFNNYNLPFVLQTVSSVTVDDGNGVIATTSYSYAGGLYDSLERDFLGFERATQTNPDNTSVTTWYHQDSFRKGRQYQVDTNKANGALLGRTTLTWEDPAANSPWAFVKLQQKRTDLWEDGIVTIFTQEDYTAYDTTGNLLTSVMSGTGLTESITTTNQYANLGGTAGWLWRLNDTTITGSTSGKIRQTTLHYHTDGTGNLWQKELWFQGGINPTTEILSYQYGNPTAVKDANGNITTTEYDAATKTYPVTITYPPTTDNPNGTPQPHIVKQGNYDYRYGRPGWAEDENLSQTSYTYDTFGRLKQVDLPDGGQTLTTFNDTAFPREVLTTVKENASGQTIAKRNYLDGLGRGIQTTTYGEAGKLIVSYTTYNTMGRVERTDGPFFPTQNGEMPANRPWRQFTYDDQGRPLTITTPAANGQTATSHFSYSGLATTVTDPDDKTKTETKDALGRLLLVTEHDGTTQYQTSYTYNAAGDLRTVTDPHGSTTVMTYDTLGRKETMTDPDMGHWSYTYDQNGNLLTQTDAKLQTITFTYDELNRIKTKSYSTADPMVTYTYDNTAITNGKGRLSSVSNTAVTNTVKGYDAMGRVTELWKDIAGNATTFKTRTAYDLSGKVKELIYPEGNFAVTYAYYPGSGLLWQVTGPGGTHYATYSDFDPAGKTGRVVHANGTQTSFSYDPDTSRLTGLLTEDPTGTDLQHKSYQYSTAGDLNSITDQLAAVTYSYTYDNLHRLRAESHNGPSPQSSFDYNAIGNLTRKTVGTNTLSYDYYDPAHKHAVSRVTLNNTTHYPFSYDANGNMTDGHDLTDLANVASRHIDYNADNMPTRITRNGVATDITYDGGGNRAKKVGPAGATYYIGEHYAVENGVATKYIMAGGERIAKVTATATHYFHKDHLGSATLVTDHNGAVLESTSYQPFGETRSHTGTEVSNYKFTGQELDPETGLYNYNARLYDPALGRFISADTIVPNFADPQSLNRYSYCRNNPLRYVDPSGHYSLDDFFDDVGDFFEDFGPTIVAIGVAAVVGPWAGAYISGLTMPAGYGCGVLASEVAAWEMTSAIGGGMIAGAAAGGSAALLSGGNVGQGALSGAALGFAGGAIGVPNFHPFGDSAVGGIGNNVFNSGLTGGALGATYAGVTGGDIGQGAARGAALWAAGAAGNMLVGHTVGLIASGGKLPVPSNGAFVYDTPFFDSAITFGNVVIGGSDVLSGPVWQGSFLNHHHTIFEHELGHIPQGTLLGPGYLPTHALTMSLGGLVGVASGSGFMNGTHTYGLLERTFHSIPNW